MTTARNYIVSELELLIGKRFNEESLNNELSKIFCESIKVLLDTDDDNENSDYHYTFSSDDEEFGGEFDLYFLKHKNIDELNNTLYITDIDFNFF